MQNLLLEVSHSYYGIGSLYAFSVLKSQQPLYFFTPRAAPSGGDENGKASYLSLSTLFSHFLLLPFILLLFLLFLPFLFFK